MRGPIAPPQVPLAASRAEAFADLVQDSVERLERRWPQLADIDFLVLEVPRLDGPGQAWNDEAVPLGGTISACEGRPARVVVYRGRSRSAPRGATSGRHWCTRSSWSRSPSCSG